MLALAVLGLGVWGLAVKSGQDEPNVPAAAPSTGTFSTLHPALIGPPPWVRYETPIEGRWVAGAGSGKVTLLVRNAYVDLWQGVGQRQGQPSTRRVMVMMGDRVYLRRPGDNDQVATYRWQITRDHLTFELDDEDPGTGFLALAGLSFMPAR